MDAENKHNENKNSNKLIKSGFVVGIFAFVLSWVPIVGLVLGVIAIALLVVGAKTSEKLPIESGKFIAGSILAVIAFAIALFITLGTFGAYSPKSTDYSEELKYQEVDVAGLTVKEACTKISEKGWPKIYVKGSFGNRLIRDSNCDDEEIVNRANYYTSFVELVFDIDDRSELTDSEKARYDEYTKNSDSSSDSSTQSFKETMDEYEAFIDEYVVFMKKYNENSSDSVLVSEYVDMMTQYAKFTDTISEIDQDRLTAAEEAYYIKVNNRVLKKLSEIK